MLRRIQKIGSSYYISLPSRWIKDYNLSKGSEVIVKIEEGGGISIVPFHEKKAEEKEVKLHYSQEIERKLLSYYLLGYDLIRIVKEDGFKHEERQSLIKFARKLSGIEVVEESSKVIALQSLIDDSSIDPIKLLFRLSSITSTMYVDVLRNAPNNEGIIKVIIERDEEVDRLYFLLVRQLRSLVFKPNILSRLELTLLDCLDLRIAAHFIEKIGDESVKLANYLSLNKKYVSINLINELSSIAENLQVLQEKSLIYFIKKKPEVNEIKKELIKIDQYLDDSRKRSLSYDIPILDIMKSIISFNIDICDLAIYY